MSFCSFLFPGVPADGCQYGVASVEKQGGVKPALVIKPDGDAVGDNPEYPVLDDAPRHHPGGDDADGCGECVADGYRRVGETVEDVVEQGEQGGDGKQYSRAQAGSQGTVENLFLLCALCPLPETVDADGNVVDVQPHIRIYLGKEEDKNVEKGSQDADYPHGAVLPDFQEQVKQTAESTEIFQ